MSEAAAGPGAGAPRQTERAGLDPRTRLGAVRLTVADLARAAAFYEQAIGLRPLGHAGEVVALGTAAGHPLVELAGRPQAPPRPVGTTGLFHLALLVPDRIELARAVRRVVGAGWSFTGASDHLVSEALYLHDPEGNGIELYRDRPRERWSRRNGEIAMGTEPLDLPGLLAEPTEPQRGEALAEGTRLGHVHLQVADLRAAEDFYGHGLGFDVTVRGYPGALFLSAGGYHHHVGLNTWAGRGALAPPPAARGLGWFVVELVDEAAREAAGDRLEAGGHPVERREDGLLARDPSGNAVLLSVGAGSQPV